MSTHNDNTQSQLAKLLATENITVRRVPGAQTAYFDLKNRVLALPVWEGISEDLADMLLIHETGHALDTPLDKWEKEIPAIAKRVLGAKLSAKGQTAVKNFMNVIEDARIDKRQKRRYPGCRRNYVHGYKELLDRDFFGTSRKKVNDFCFIDRVNIFFKAGAMTGVSFTSAEQVIVDKIANAETFDEVVALTEECFRFAKFSEKFQESETNFDNLFDKITFEEVEGGDDVEPEDADLEVKVKNPAPKSDEDEDDTEDSKSKATTEKSDDESDDEDADGTDSSDDADSDDDEGNSDASDNDPSDEESNGGKSDDAEGDEPSDDDNESDVPAQSKSGNGHGSGDDAASEDFIPDSETEKNYQRSLEALVSSEKVNFRYVTIPTKMIYDSVVHDYKIVQKEMDESMHQNYREERWWALQNENFQKWKQDENATISFMVKEFETLKSAAAYSKSLTSKTGVIDTNKLHSYRYNDDVFRRNTVIPNGKNHGFILVLDWSGSMTTDLRNTLNQLFSLTLFCRRVQIPFEVYIFRDAYDRQTGKQFEYAQDDIQFGSFAMRNVLSSRMNAVEFNRQMLNLWCIGAGGYNACPSDPLNGTPLNQAIVATSFIAQKFKAQYKIEVLNIIFLTDGDSNGCQFPTAPYSGGGYHMYAPTKTSYQDMITKRTYSKDETGLSAYGTDLTTTNVLYQSLKDRTGANVVGFFLYGSGHKNLLSNFYPSLMNTEEGKKIVAEYKENGFVPVKNFGMDEYYIIDTKNMRIDHDDMIVDKKMTASAVAKGFMKFTAKKLANRVLLRQFIRRISRDAA